MRGPGYGAAIRSAEHAKTDGKAYPKQGEGKNTKPSAHFLLATIEHDDGACKEAT